MSAMGSSGQQLALTAAASASAAAVIAVYLHARRPCPSCSSGGGGGERRPSRAAEGEAAAWPLLLPLLRGGWRRCRAAARALLADEPPVEVREEKKEGRPLTGPSTAFAAAATAGPSGDVVKALQAKATKASLKARFRAKARMVTALHSLVRQDSAIRWQAERSDPMNVMREAVVIVMVGLPARGKSFISNSLVRYLRVIGVSARCFNAGKLRRAHGEAGVGADFFSASNANAKAQRDRLAMECTDMMLQWIYTVPSDSTTVAILDATNTTRARREAVMERCRAAAANAAMRPESNPPPLRVVFLESICDAPDILQANYKMKLGNDDYKGSADPDAALSDFKKRVQAYVEQYQPLEDSEVVHPGVCPESDTEPITGLVRIVNGGQKLQCCNLGCSMVILNITMLLSCFHLAPRRIFLVPESAVDAPALAKLLLDAEKKDECGRPVDLLCCASRHAVRMARQVESLLQEEGGSPYSSNPCLSEEGLRQPRSILILRNLQQRAGEYQAASAGGSSDDLNKARDDDDEVVAEETWADLVQRLKEAILIIERLPRSLIVLCPAEEVLRVLLAHFHGCPEEMRPWSMRLPEGPIIELQRDHTGFAMSASWPPPAASAA